MSQNDLVFSHSARGGDRFGDQESWVFENECIFYIGNVTEKGHTGGIRGGRRVCGKDRECWKDVEIRGRIFVGLSIS